MFVHNEPYDARLIGRIVKMLGIKYDDYDCLVAALRSRCGYFIFCLWFLSSSSFFFSSPNLSRRRLDVYHTSVHDVALVRIWNACLKYAARGSLKIQDAKNPQNSPSGHHRTTFSGCIFTAKPCIASICILGMSAHLTFIYPLK